MHRKILSAILAVVMVMGLTACRKFDKTLIAVQTTTVPTTEPTTVTTTAAPTIVATTKPTTTKKKVTTTVKRVVTTIAQTTKIDEDAEFRTEDHAENEALKYGVYRSRAIKTTYIKHKDGSEEVYNEDITDLYTRIGYHASYEDLLPAAQENKNKYKSEINEVLKIINSFRKEGGLEPLVLDDQLITVACARAEEIAWSGRFSHYRPNGSSILRDAGIAKGSAGENIARGFSEPDDVCQAWKASETHYENIMNPEFTKIGIGVAADPDPAGKLCWSQLFIDKME